MDINIRRVAAYVASGGWHEVTVKEGGTTIKFDVNNNDYRDFAKDIVFSILSEMDSREVTSLLTELDYADDIIEKYKEDLESDS